MDGCVKSFSKKCNMDRHVKSCSYRVIKEPAVQLSSKSNVQFEYKLRVWTRSDPGPTFDMDIPNEDFVRNYMNEDGIVEEPPFESPYGGNKLMTFRRELDLNEYWYKMKLVLVPIASRKAYLDEMYSS